MVTMKLIEPSSELVMIRTIDRPQIVCPTEAMSESGGYDVHPDCAAPPGMKKDDIMRMQPGRNTQYDAMLSRGNAMSGAPICSGVTKFPNPPTASGTTPR